MARLADHRTKIELLRAAEGEFAEHGLANAKVDAITARAGVSKGAFYLHFESKEDCFRLIVESFLARFAAHIEPPPFVRDDTPSNVEEFFEQALAHAVTIFEVCWQNRGLLRMLLAGGGGAPHAYLVEEFRERVRQQTEDWIRTAVEGGLYRDDIDPKVVSALVSGGYDRLTRDLIQLDRKPDIEAWCKQAIDLFARGLLARPEDGRIIFDPKVNREKKR
jgi:AcrR family transcriptional regulator